MTIFTLHHGDCLDVLSTLPENSIDAVVTDPPYGLEFMGMAWDTMRTNGTPRTPNTWGDFGSREHPRNASEQARIMGRKGRALQEFSYAWAVAVLRVLKPGGHLLACGGTRTYHRMVCAIEDAGFECRDSLAWLHGQGFPKNMDISKQIDRMAGAEREVVGQGQYDARRPRSVAETNIPGAEYGFAAGHVITAPATPAAQQWQGWGTALKPGMELVCLARKPLSEPTVAANVLRWGTGALNIDAGRIAHDEPPGQPSDGLHGKSSGIMGQTVMRHRETTSASTQGRWPANVLLDEAAAALLDEQSGERQAGAYPALRNVSHFGNGRGTNDGTRINLDTGGASRFFYTAKASRSERSKGLEERDAIPVNDGRQTSIDNPYQRGDTPRQNIHPTVKPLSLMRYLIRLITPPGGVVLDPFMGSGSTGVAALDCGFAFVGIEREAEYLAIADARIAAAQVLPLPLETLL